MFYLMYLSTAVQLMNENELDSILDQSRKNNLKANITGMLLYKSGVFMQMLEGEKETVLNLYDKIEKDPRHKNSTLILSGNIQQRHFKDWSMGFVNMDEIKNLPKYQDYFKQNIGLMYFEKEQDEAYEFINLFNEINR